MNLPRQVPFAYAGVFLIWGAACGNWMVAIAAAVLLELPMLLKRFWHVEDKAYRSAWLMALLLEWILAVSGWLELSRADAVRSVLKWSPLALFPLALASAVANNPGVPLSALLLLLGKKFSRPSVGGVVPEMPRLDPFFPYLWVVLLAAGYQDPGGWFYPVVSALIAYVVLAGMRRHRGWRECLGWTAAASLAGIYCYTGIAWIYQYMESAMYGRIEGGSGQEINRAVTSIGTIGKIKLRQDVLWRVTYEHGPIPEYLYEASYDHFNPAQNIWNNQDQMMRQYDRVVPAGQSDPPATWQLGGGDDVASCRVRGAADYDFTVLPLPFQTGEIQQLPAFRMDRNGLGVVRANCAQPVVDFRAVSSTTWPLRAPAAAKRDLGVHPQLKLPFAGKAAELGLNGLPADQVIAKVRAYFADGFSYTLKPEGAPVDRFLTSDKRGHCEYFATATVLLLRSAGVPARYNTGFALGEYDAKARQWKVRGIHAHAWATAWVNGQWRVVETTPPGWLVSDSHGMHVWQALADWWDEKWIAFQLWRASLGGSGVMVWLVPGAIVLVVLYTVVRLVAGTGKKRRRLQQQRVRFGYAPWHGSSRWLDLLPDIERTFGPRPPEIPSVTWVRDLPGMPDSARTAAITLVAGHNQRRFGDPSGDAAESPDLPEAGGRLQKFLAGTGKPPAARR